MKILQISDTHNKHHLLVNLPEADVIVHCGDFTDNGTEKEVLDFLNWFIMLPYKHKIFVTGNHDTCLWDAEAIEDLPKNVHFLQDSECKIEGITFFGLAYNHSEQVIPPDADVLVSHEPPFMILDKDNNIHWGNADLKKKDIGGQTSLSLFWPYPWSLRYRETPWNRLLKCRIIL